MNFIRFITPTNLAEEKERFFSSESYEPKFQYDWNTKEVERWLEKNHRHNAIVKAVLRQDHSAIVSEASLLFQIEIKPRILKEAEKIIYNTQPFYFKTDIETLMELFNEAFSYFGINYKTLTVDKHGFNLRPNHSKKKMLISKYLSLDFFSPEGEVRHELTHVLRYINGKHNTISQSKDYLPTEEGLATYFHDYGGREENYSLFQHAAEYGVTNIGLQSGLRKIVDTLINWGFRKELAWQRAVRHKFGFIDTSQPGDIMKPAMYFYHQLRIKRLTNNERLRLMIGKISAADLNKYPSYRGIVPEEKIKSFFLRKNTPVS